ncbi:MAG: hypothetical protein IPL53_13605 [Ignavibacteria bacterium]|nr:hypothetical protein [Ignavibacteria bacterium]
MKRFILLVLIFLLSNKVIISQDITPLFDLKLNSPKEKTESANSTLPIAIGVAGFLYLFNPVVLIENDKIAFGFTKELSLGFGYFGQHRISAEYSYIFVNSLKSRLFIGFTEDILLKKIKPSNTMQGTSVIALGSGYFTNFDRSGVYGDVAYGYSIRNDKLLFFPSVKLRFTYVHNGSDILDISAGIVIGIANPFMDLKIRRSY